MFFFLVLHIASLVPKHGEAHDRSLLVCGRVQLAPRFQKDPGPACEVSSCVELTQDS